MKEIMPQVSIIVPVYNTRNFLEECIQSVLAQSYSNWELILSDDGSTDGSIELCKKYEQEDSRICVLYNHHQGVSAARNAGIKKAKGVYITFLDSDDWLDRDFLQTAIKECTQQSLDIYMAGVVRVSNGKPIRKGIVDVSFLADSQKLSEAQLIELVESNYIASCWANIYRKKIVEGIFFDTSMNWGEDMKFVFQLISRPRRIFADNKVLYYYRDRDGSATMKVNQTKCTSMVKLYSFLIEDAKKRDLKAKDYYSFIVNRSQNDLQYTKEMILTGNYSYKEKKQMLKIISQKEEYDGGGNLKKENTRKKIKKSFRTELTLLKWELTQLRKK